MKAHRLLLALTVAACLAPAAFAEEDTPPTFVVSSELMDTLEEWSSPTLSAETLALESRPELIEEYAALAEEHHGQPLADVFAEQLPQTWAEIAEAFGGPDEGGEAPAAAEILAYAMAGGSEEFVSWQSSLAGSGDDFHGFIATFHPEVADEIAELGPSPASQGVGLRTFAEAKGTAGGLDALTIEPHQPDMFALRCSCFTAVSFDDYPGGGWTTQANEHQHDKSGFLDVKQKYLDYTLKARGAARELEFSLRTEHQVSEEQREMWGDSSYMRINMSCLEMPFMEGRNPRACGVANACSGRLYARVGYGSKVYENHSVGGPWTRDAKVLSADFARLTHQVVPGSSAATVRFAKGVALAGSYRSDWGLPYSQATQFYAMAGVPLFTALVGTPNMVTLGTNLNDPNVAGFAGLGALHSVAGNYALTMKAAWGGSQLPLYLLPGQTHVFRLTTASRVLGSGMGGQSDNRAHLDSSAYLLAVIRSFSCASGVHPPVERAFWNYGAAPDAPYDLDALRGMIRDQATYAGFTVFNLNRTPGQYP